MFAPVSHLAGKVTPLGIAATLLGGSPALGVCIYLCWRILRAQADPTNPALAVIGSNR
ncbi:hypothetical protein AB0L53_44360 [Nonomuraea sp. NPDC052129]|uniref:hypothetical protein n=1 Tax=Nonomuraea sp. NPDC052129 TaxID=3154651 RepID=UPI003433EF4D